MGWRKYLSTGEEATSGSSSGGPPSGPAGGDLGGSYPNPTVTQARGLRETSGPTTLAMGAVADLQVLQRSGTSIIGIAVVPATRNVNTAAPLGGGGALSSDLSLTVSDFVASGVGHARGTVPDPGASAGTTKFLREDATWAVPPGGGGSIALTQNHILVGNASNIATDVALSGDGSIVASGALTVLGLSTSWVLTGVISPSSLGSNQNSYNPAGIGTASVIRLTASTPVNITGLKAQATGSVYALYNIGSNAITLTNQDAASTAADRFLLLGDLKLLPGDGIVLWYDGTTSRWRCASNPRVPYGSAIDTICQGNDSRLSDARTPVGTALTSANIWVGNGSNLAAAVAMSGDITITNAGVTAIGANKVLDTMLRQGAAMTVIGRSANSTGNVADIATSADGDVLRRSGTTLGFGTIVASAIGSGTIATARLGSGTANASSYLRGDQTWVIPPGRLMSIQKFTASASGTYTTPANITAIWVRCVGGAGGGGGAAQGVGQSAVGGGGAAGGYCEKYITSPSATYSYTVGAGGAGGTAGANDGTAGTDTTFGSSLLVASKGNGGKGGSAAAAVGVVLGGTSIISTGGDINSSGMTGILGIHLATTTGISGSGGSGPFGSGGASINAEGVGNAGLGNGAGGGGGMCQGTTARAGGVGTDGAIFVYEYS